MKHSEGSLVALRNQSVYFQYWLPDVKPKALLLIVHGAGEHGGRYQHVAAHFAQLGFAVAALDHPGHGKSEGQYGHIERLDELVETVSIFHDQLIREFVGIPCFMIGHSMGGLIASLYLLKRQHDLAGCVLSGPAVKSEIEPGFMQFLTIRFLSAFAPRAKVLQLDARGVSRDPKVVAEYEGDPLVNHSKMSARMVYELFSGMERIQGQAQQISLPILIMHGEADLLTAPDGSRELYNGVSSKDKTLKMYPELYHEIFNEPERMDVLSYLEQWLNQRLEDYSVD
ncbi:MAG: lysophospholipase [Pseudomonadota bacterium]